MAVRPPLFRPRGQGDPQSRRRAYDQRRGTARERGYDAQWERERVLHLAEHPLCVMCLAEDAVTPAAVVDHVIPHRGDRHLFWDPSNWQSLCRHCHSSVKQREERRGH